MDQLTIDLLHSLHHGQDSKCITLARFGVHESTQLWDLQQTQISLANFQCLVRKFHAVFLPSTTLFVDSILGKPAEVACKMVSSLTVTRSATRRKSRNPNFLCWFTLTRSASGCRSRNSLFFCLPLYAFSYLQISKRFKKNAECNLNDGS